MEGHSTAITLIILGLLIFVGFAAFFPDEFVNIGKAVLGKFTAKINSVG
ncbi:hypothetical protein [Rummeliibacillus pycnus]